MDQLVIKSWRAKSSTLCYSTPEPIVVPKLFCLGSIQDLGSPLRPSPPPPIFQASNTFCHLLLLNLNVNITRKVNTLLTIQVNTITSNLCNGYILYENTSRIYVNGPASCINSMTPDPPFWEPLLAHCSVQLTQSYNGTREKYFQRAKICGLQEC